MTDTTKADSPVALADEAEPETQSTGKRAWWISTFPGIAILSVVVACNLVGDGLRSALDPRMRIDR